MNTITRLATIALAFAASAVHASPIPIADLFNTGVDPSGAALGDGAPDPHYTILGSGPAITVTAGLPPFPAWVANNSGSRWVGLQANGGGPSSTNFTYRTTFTIPADADLSTVAITGAWGTDNPGIDILVNSISTGLTNPTQFVSLTPFTIPNTGQYVHGINTLDFEIRNFSGFTGLRVDRLQGTFVPEPSGLAAALLGLVSLAGVGRRGAVLS